MAVQVMGLLPVQAPPWHVSVWVHASASLQDVPSALAGGTEHRPVAGEQIPGSWQSSPPPQTTGLPPVQTPVWQLSVCVQALPSSQAVPSTFGVPMQPEPFGTDADSHGPGAQAYTVPAHTPAPSQRSSLVPGLRSLQLAVVLKLALTQTPALHASLVQSLPSLQSAAPEQPLTVTLRATLFDVPPSKSSIV